VTKVPSSAEAAQVTKLAQRPEHPTGPNTDERLVGVGKHYGDGKGEPSLRPQGPDPLPDRSV
jgi:hypothetical protein